MNNKIKSLNNNHNSNNNFNSNNYNNNNNNNYNSNKWRNKGNRLKDKQKLYKLKHLSIISRDLKF